MNHIYAISSRIPQRIPYFVDLCRHFPLKCPAGRAKTLVPRLSPLCLLCLGFLRNAWNAWNQFAEDRRCSVAARGLPVVKQVETLLRTSEQKYEVLESTCRNHAESLTRSRVERTLRMASVSAVACDIWFSLSTLVMLML